MKRQFISLCYIYVLLNSVINGQVSETKNGSDLTSTSMAQHGDNVDAVTPQVPLVPTNASQADVENEHKALDHNETTRRPNVTGNGNNEVPETTNEEGSACDPEECDSKECTECTEGSCCTEPEDDFYPGPTNDRTDSPDSTSDILIALLILLALLVVCSLIGILVCVLQRRMYTVLHSEISRG